MLDNCIKLSLAVVLVLGITAMPAAAAVVWPYTSGDLFIDELNPYYNANNNALAVENITGNMTYSLLKFDTLSVNLAGAVVNSATLNLQRVDSWSANPTAGEVVEARQITDTATWPLGSMSYGQPPSPAESGATWTFANYWNPDDSATHWSGGDNAISLGGVVDSEAIVDGNTINQLDVTEIFQNWADGQLNNGIALTTSGGTPTGAHWYTSLEYADGVGGTYGLAPFVELNYIPVSGPGPPDMNGDGNVDSGDAFLLRDQWGETEDDGTTWVFEDYDLDGDLIIGLGDFDIVKANWYIAPGAASVPEPGSLVMLSLGSLVLLVLRRRCRV